MLLGKDMNPIEELKDSGLSISQSNEVNGYDRRRVRKYLLSPGIAPRCGRRSPGPRVWAISTNATLKRARETNSITARVLWMRAPPSGTSLSAAVYEVYSRSTRSA